MTINKQALRQKSESASAGEWVKESGAGWHAVCSSDDQATSGFIVAHFEGPDSNANREFVQAANPATVLALLDELEAAEKLIAEFDQRIRTQNRHACELFDEAKAQRQRTAELEASHSKLRESMAAIHNTIHLDGVRTSLTAMMGAAKRAHDESSAAAGISIKGE